MKIKTISRIRLGDMLAEYRQNENSGLVELVLLPWSRRNDVVERRDHLPDDELPGIAHLPEKWRPVPANRELDSLIQLRLRGDDPCGGYSTGLTMRDSPNLAELEYKGQKIRRTRPGISIDTRFVRSNGLECVHHLLWNKGEQGVRIKTTVRNSGKSELTLEMLASFSLGNLTPFASDDAPGRLLLHRYRSNWSNEGRPLVESLESLNLERSWMGVGVRTERFGQVGSMPVNRWFPQVALQDTAAGVTWAAQIAWCGSWQLEVFRLGDAVCLSGGLADREFGHWWKSLGPGDRFTSPEARLTVVEGDAAAAAERLTGLQKSAVALQPRVEQNLPVVFNEWCSSWGAPTHDSLVAMADRLKGSGVKYLVIDAGWSIRGDWVLDRKRFPHGLKATCDAIRKRGLIPGIWFEFEVAASNSKAYALTDHVLKLDGVPLNPSDRHFWDFRDPWTHAYLGRKVIKLLRDAGFGYLKVDYNATIGIGVDGAESPGEGLRQHLEGVRSFFQRIRKSLPGLVIENCSSGGHRLEPSMQELCAMGVFSDAHESLETPILAANLHRHILPRQSQVWAVLRQTDDMRRLTYSMTALFLGRAALSGDLLELSQSQWRHVQAGLALYRKAVPVIRSGSSAVHRFTGETCHHPQGWQAVVRTARDGKSALVVVHAFDGELPDTLSFPMGNRHAWKITGAFRDPEVSCKITRGICTITRLGNRSGAAFLLQRS